MSGEEHEASFRSSTRSGIEVVERGADGVAIVSYDAEDARADATSDSQTRRLADRMVAAEKTWHSRWRILPSGYVVKAVAGAKPSGGPMQLAIDDSVEEIGVVFPDAPIGNGATWRAETKRTWSGFTWHRTVTYHLEDITGTTAKVVVDGSSRAESDTLSVEPQVTTRLTSGTSTATAHLTVSLLQPMPTGAETISFELNLAAVGQRSRASSTLSGEIEMTLSSADGQEPVTPAN